MCKDNPSDLTDFSSFNSPDQITTDYLLIRILISHTIIVVQLATKPVEYSQSPVVAQCNWHDQGNCVQVLCKLSKSLPVSLQSSLNSFCFNHLIEICAHHSTVLVITLGLNQLQECFDDLTSKPLLVSWSILISNEPFQHAHGETYSFNSDNLNILRVLVLLDTLDNGLKTWVIWLILPLCSVLSREQSKR